MSDDQGLSLEVDPRGGNNTGGAVLLADEINYYCTSDDIQPDQRMIEPYVPQRLRPASYQLTLGKEAHIGGRTTILDEAEPLILEPHQVAVVSTSEIVRIPRFLIARWSLRVGKIYEGLLWTGGLQVDPGWVGRLFCPIYNLAEHDVELSAGDGFFTIDFIRTTPLTDQYQELRGSPKYSAIWFKPAKRSLAEHDSRRLHSAPHAVLEKLAELRRFSDFALPVATVIFTVLAIMVAALSVIAMRPVVKPGEPFLSFWPMTALVTSAVALVLVVLCLAFIYRIFVKLRR